MSTGCVCTADQFPGWCDRHQLRKAKRWAELCSEREDYFRAFEEGRGPGQKNGKPVPKDATIHGPRSVPCVLRGDQVGTADCKPCQNGGIAKLAVFKCEKHGHCAIQNRGGKWEDKPLTACITCPDRQEPPPPPPKVTRPDIRDSVTICITEFLRPDALKRCLESIQRELPDVRVDVEPTGGNLSRARNNLAKRCRTPFYMMMEEDFVLDNRTDLAAMHSVMEHDDQLAVVSAITVEPRNKGTAGRGGNYFWQNDIARVRNIVFQQPPYRAKVTTPEGVTYQPCDVTLNFGLFRVEALKAVPWDESIPVGAEHMDWYYSLYMDARWHCALIAKPMVVHMRDRPGPEYNKPRNRSFHYRLKEKHNVQFVWQNPPVEKARNGMPNIIYLTTGRANSSIYSRMAIEAFGFHGGQLDEQYYEEKRVRAENNRMRHQGSMIDRVTAERILRTIPQPWLIKDPRFAFTLGRWHGVLQRYKPHLIFIHKDPATVDESMKAAGWTGIKGYHEASREQFEKWPWAKTELKAETIGDALAAFDPGRMKHRAETPHIAVEAPHISDGQTAEAALDKFYPGWREEIGV